MRRVLISALVLCIACGVFFGSGCGVKKSGSANEAIQYAQALKTVEEKADYLIGQARAFYNSKEFQQAIQAAQYVLSNLDKNSQPAKDLIEKAKAQLQAAAQKAAGDATNKLFGK
ncbi:MAG: tetratricopeptide repeat protein [Candidatus Omnitrophota bacterium]